MSITKLVLTIEKQPKFPISKFRFEGGSHQCYCYWNIIENIQLGIKLDMYVITVFHSKVTDGSSGAGSIGRNHIIQALPLPPPYPARISILPVVSPHDPCLQHGKYIATLSGRLIAFAYLSQIFEILM